MNKKLGNQKFSILLSWVYAQNLYIKSEHEQKLENKNTILIYFQSPLKPSISYYSTLSIRKMKQLIIDNEVEWILKE